MNRRGFRNCKFIKQEDWTRHKEQVRNPRSNRSGEVAEWSKAAVLKTVEGQPSVGSNPTLSANRRHFGSKCSQSLKNAFPIWLETP